MKLSNLSKNVLAPLAAFFTLLSAPAFAKSDILDKGYAMGVHAGAHCYADKGWISEYEVNAITKDVSFASHLPIYPPCFVDPENTDFTPLISDILAKRLLSKISISIFFAFGFGVSINSIIIIYFNRKNIII